MTEEQAIKRIYVAIHREFGTQFDEGYDEPTVARMSKAAWDEMKAIAREERGEPPAWFREAYAQGTAGDQRA